MKSDLTIFSDEALTWELDLDKTGEPESHSLYIKSDCMEIRQFCKLEQLYDLQRMLNRELPPIPPIKQPVAESNEVKA